MAKITYVQPSGERETLEVENGLTVMEGAYNNDVEGIVAACGGSCSCSTCHVYIDPEWRERVGGPHAAEEDTLELADDVRESSRLSCQIEVSEELDGLVVHVPTSQAI